MAVLKYETKDAIPEDLQSFAEENKDGGGYVVTVGPKRTLNEFRENNQKLQNEKDEALSKLKTLEKVMGDDPEEFKTKLDELTATAQKVEDGKLKGSEEIEKEVDRRVAAAKAANDAKLLEKDNEIGVLTGTIKERDKTIYNTELADYIRGEAVREDIGVNTSALNYIIADAEKEFEKDDDGNFVRRVNGKVQLGEDGYSPQTGNEWLKARKESSPFFFKQSSGGGADGDSSSKFGGLSQKDFMNLSPAEKLEIANSQ